MEYNIRAYVDELFRDVPDTQRAYEMKVELTQNLLDKYNDLVASGKSEDDAYNITIYGIGDISELLEEMRREEPEVRSAQGATYYTAMSYFRRRSALLVSIGVMLYIFSLIPVIVLGVLSTMTGEPFLAAAGCAGMFAFVGVATALMIWNGCTKPKRSDPPEIVIDMYNRKKGNASPILKAIDASFWLVIVAVYFLVSIISGRWNITWILFIVAPAIQGVVHALMNHN